MAQASRLDWLGFGWLGAVRRATALAFAIVLARVLAAALSLAVILAFARVLRQCRFVLPREQDASNRLGCRSIAGLRGWLSMKANSCAAKKTGECCCQSE